LFGKRDQGKHQHGPACQLGFNVEAFDYLLEGWILPEPQPLDNDGCISGDIDRNNPELLSSVRHLYIKIVEKQCFCACEDPCGCRRGFEDVLIKEAGFLANARSTLRLLTLCRIPRHGGGTFLHGTGFKQQRKSTTIVTRIKEDQEPEIMEHGLLRSEVVEFWVYRRRVMDILHDTVSAMVHVARFNDFGSL
jgi:hypothetical protein